VPSHSSPETGRKITALHVGHWLPELIEWRGEAALVYRTLAGWEYTFIQHDGGPLGTRDIAIGDGTFAGTVHAARRHLVDVAWRFGDPVDLFPEWFDNRDERRASVAASGRFATSGSRWKARAMAKPANIAI
jgi:hypothetical protein